MWFIVIMNHIVCTFPLTKFEGGLNLLHKVNNDSHVDGIYSDCSTHKKIIIVIYFCVAQFHLDQL